MAFLESPRFPETVAIGAEGGPSWLTEVVQVSSGAEQRISRWSAPRQRYSVAFVNRSQAELDAMLAFFRVVGGRRDGFRFRDHGDYSVATAGVDGVLALISGNTYQLYKRYTAGAQTFDRKIIKPIDPVQIAGGGTYSVNYTTGVVTHSAGAAPTGWTGQFDVPVRFVSDQMSPSLTPAAGGRKLFSWDPIELLEIRA